MKTLRNLFLAIATWAMMSVSAMATDVIVVSHGQANDPFWSVAKNGVDSACKDMEYLASTLRQEHLTWLKWQN